MATLTGKIADVTGRAPDSISSITVKAPSARIGGGSDVIVSSPAEVTFDKTTGDITISGLTGGLSWIYIEGDGWSDSIPLAVAEGIITLVEAVANAAGASGLADYIRLLTELETRIDDIGQAAIDAALETKADKSEMAGKADTSYVDAANQALGQRITDEKWMRGAIPAGTDLDTITTSGGWWQPAAPSATEAHHYPVQSIGYLDVTTWTGRTVQTYYPEQGGVWTRRLAYGQWSSWWASHDNRGDLPAGTDMDQVRDLAMHGTWTITNGTAPTIVNGPPNLVRGTLELLTTHLWTIVQRFNYYSGEVWQRTPKGGSAWGPWRKVAFHDDVEALIDGLELTPPEPPSDPIPVSQDWVHWGDSLTDDMVTGADAWVTQLAAKTGRTHSNQGWYGQSLRNISARAGALQPIITVEGGSIPAAGGTVALSSVTNMPTTNNKRTQFRGVLAGREGYLSTTSTGVDQFTATSGTAATTCPPNAVFTITEPEATTPNRHATIWGGFNDRYDMEPWEIVSIIGEVVERHTIEGARRAMVFQLPHSGSSTPGTAIYQKVVDTNRLMEQAFPTLYLPICDWLQTEEAAQVAGIEFTEQDRADIANGIVPTSFRSDYVHFNAAGCTAIAAYVYDQAAARGWVAGESIYSSMRHAGIPVDLGYRGTGSPEGKVAAPVGSVYTDTAATIGAIRWIKTSGSGNTGWRVEYGDTGWRDITSQLTPAPTSGQLKIRIRNGTLTLQAFWLAAPQGDLVANLPREWAPLFNSGGDFRSSLGKPIAEVRFTFAGVLTIKKLDSGLLDSTMSYVAKDGWPATYLGTPV